MDPVDALVADGPGPLAQLARRARNAETVSAMLQNAGQYLAEAGARLGAAYWLGRALAAGEPTPAMQHQLGAILTRGPSLGTSIGGASASYRRSRSSSRGW